MQKDAPGAAGRRRRRGRGRGRGRRRDGRQVLQRPPLRGTSWDTSRQDVICQARWLFVSMHNAWRCRDCGRYVAGVGWLSSLPAILYHTTNPLPHLQPCDFRERVAMHKSCNWAGLGEGFVRKEATGALSVASRSTSRRRAHNGAVLRRPGRSGLGLPGPAERSRDQARKYY